MISIRKLRKSVGYERNVPRCANCAQYKPLRMWMLNSLPRVAPPACKLHGFTVEPMSICDTWQSKSGAKAK